MEDSRIHIRYAKALFEIAEEQNFVDRAYEDTLLIKDVCKSNKDFEMLLASPIIHTGKKVAIIKEVFTNSLHPVSLSFLLLIIKKRREANIRLIAESFIHIYKEYKGIKTAYLKTAIELDETTRKEFVALLAGQTNKTIELREIVKPELLGGFVITIDDKESDNSISDKIQRLKKEYDVNIYEKKL
ncbi:MAG: ATP synthase F1 subunit delta [Bacteroidota bacterium]